MPYVDVWAEETDIDVDDVLAEYAHEDWVSLVEDWREQIIAALHSQVEPTAWLDDPVKRLEAITWLRANGYTVEPVS